MHKLIDEYRIKFFSPLRYKLRVCSGQLPVTAKFVYPIKKTNKH